MKLPAKVIAAIVVVVALAGLGLWAQRASSGQTTIKLNAHDMEVLYHQVFPPDEQQQIASDPDGKNKVIEYFKSLFAIAQQAEMEGYDKTMEMELTLTEDNILKTAYLQKHPDAKVSDLDVKAYYQANPDAFDKFAKFDKRAQQAEGLALEEYKKAFAQFKVTAERARAEGLDKDENLRLRMLYERSLNLARAYVRDVENKVDKLIRKEEIEQYYRAHQDDYARVLIRRIQISPDLPDARQKAEEALAKARSGQEDFISLVNQYSDEDTRENGGEWEGGWIGKDTRLPRGFEKFASMALSLKAGEVASEVVEVPDLGLLIIKAEKRESTSPSENEAVRQDIKKKLRAEKLQERFEQITKASRVEIAENFDTTPKLVNQPAKTDQQGEQEE